ncbi:MAG: hypothetical protein MUE30_00120 [Spirosomaceae bacterium]|nr:hypothetical protein [Spirosomataceae bacterium]
MKTLSLFFTLFLASLAAIAQNEKLYRTDHYKDFGDYEEVVTFHDKQKRFATVKIYDKEQVLRAESHYRDAQRHGQERVFYTDGSLYWKGDYKDGLPSGVFVAYYPDGTLKRKERYRHGTLKEGFCYDSLGHSITHFPFRTQPSFPNGKYALQKFIRSKWPAHLKEAYNQTTFLEADLIVGADSVARVSFLKVDDYEQRKALAAIIKAMPKWVPGTFDGQKYDTNYHLSLVVRAEGIYLSELFNSQNTLRIPEERQRISRPLSQN